MSTNYLESLEANQNRILNEIDEEDDKNRRTILYSEAEEIQEKIRKVKNDKRLEKDYKIEKFLKFFSIAGPIIVGLSVPIINSITTKHRLNEVLTFESTGTVASMGGKQIVSKSLSGK